MEHAQRGRHTPGASNIPWAPESNGRFKRFVEQSNFIKKWNNAGQGSNWILQSIPWSVIKCLLGYSSVLNHKYLS
jgi:hypothetical protein